MKRAATRRSPTGQAGIGTLAMSMLLLVGASIILFYLNRSLIFEQRSSANQLRSTTALEVAEAGVEWATGMLNRPQDMQADCSTETTPAPWPSFREKYLPSPPPGGGVRALPGCVMSGAGLTCNCPDVPASGTATAALGATVWPGFTVRLMPGGDPDSVRIVSTGCSAVAGACTEFTAPSADASAVVSATVKLSRVIRAAPAVTLSCGGTCALGTASVENLDVATNGITVDAAGPVAFTAAQLVTIAGLPPENSVLADDAALAELSAADPLCTNGTLFRSYFGSTMASFVDAPTTRFISTCSPTAPCSELITAYEEGWRSFYLQGGAQLGSVTLGSPTDPVTLVSQGALTLTDSTVVHGLVFANAVTLGAGSPTVRGAVLACASFTGPGAGRIAYDPAVLRVLQRASAVMVRVPGTWRDFPRPTL